MKLLKIYDDAHTGVKIAAAKAGKTSARIGSLLLRFALGELEAGRIQIPGDEGESVKKPAKRKSA